MRLEVILKRGESGYIVAECPALPGCWSQGKTRDEAMRNIEEAVELAIESRRALGMPVPAEADPPAVELTTVDVT